MSAPSGRLQGGNVPFGAGEKLISAPLVYRAEEIAQLLAISNRAAYNLCNTTKDFKAIRLGTSIRVSKQSYDDWFAAV